MKIESIKIFKYTLPFIKPIKIFSSTLSKREGFIIEFIGQDKKTRLGEVAPLCPISYEDLDMAYAQLVDICLKLKKNEAIDFSALYPSVLFGISSIIENPIFETFSMPYSGVDYHDFSLSKFKPLLSTYKLKLSNLDVKDACRYVRKIKQKHRKLNLRLDINQSWSYSDAVHFMNNFSPDDFEYIEEPCQSIDETKKILKNTSHNIALDESLNSWSFKELAQYKNIKALIIKPSLICFTKYLACKISIVFSSLFESGIGLLNIAKLAKIHSTSIPGLDTYRFLEYDVLQKPLDFSSEIKADFPFKLNKRAIKQCFNA